MKNEQYNFYARNLMEWMLLTQLSFRIQQRKDGIEQALFSAQKCRYTAIYGQNAIQNLSR